MKLIFLSLFLVSCSSSLKVGPGRCAGYVKLKQKKEQAQGQSSFILREFGFGQKSIDLDDLLKQAKAPECNRVSSVSLSIESDFWDQLISVIPLVSQWSISLSWDEVQKAK